MASGKNKSKARSPKRGAGFGAWSFGFKRGPELSRRAALFLLLLVLFVWLVAAAYLLLVSQTMIAARRVQDLRDQLICLCKENAALEREIAERQTVEGLLREAEAMGFVPTARLEFVEP
jgi:hypothetical protein